METQLNLYQVNHSTNPVKPCRQGTENYVDKNFTIITSNLPGTLGVSQRSEDAFQIRNLLKFEPKTYPRGTTGNREQNVV